MNNIMKTLGFGMFVFIVTVFGNDVWGMKFTPSRHTTSAKIYAETIRPLSGESLTILQQKASEVGEFTKEKIKLSPENRVYIPITKKNLQDTMFTFRYGNEVATLMLQFEEQSKFARFFNIRPRPENAKNFILSAYGPYGIFGRHFLNPESAAVEAIKEIFRSAR